MNERPRGTTPRQPKKTGDNMDVQKFTGAVVSIVVVVIIAVSVLVPIIAANQVTGIANADSINAMLNIVPLLVIVGIIIAVVALFLGNKKIE